MGHDVVGLVGQLLWGPFVAFGALCAASIWLIVIGVPLLLVVLPGFLACNERRCGRPPPASLVFAGLTAIPLLVAGSVVAVAFADGDPAAYAGLAAVVVWSIGTTIVLLQLRRSPPRFGGETEALGLWLQVLWVPMAVALLWPAGMLFGVPFLALSLAPCWAGRLRHQRRIIPIWVLVVSSLAVATGTGIAIGGVVGQDGWQLRALWLGVLLPWIVPVVWTNVLLWLRPSFGMRPRGR